ncbi:MAG: response regulator [Myxococcota bacterium]
MRIVVVDDDALACEMIVGALQRQGHAVEVMKSALGLVNRVAGRDADGRPRPDLVILDHHLPGLSGLQSLQLLAKDPVASQVPVILHSGTYLGTSEEARAWHPRCAIVEKAASFQPLMDRIRSMASSSSAEARGA